MTGKLGGTGHFCKFDQPRSAFLGIGNGSIKIETVQAATATQVDTIRVDTNHFPVLAASPDEPLSKKSDGFGVVVIHMQQDVGLDTPDFIGCSPI